MTQQGTPASALIVGAGIGGLAAAIALRQIGVEATVVERAPELNAVGAGLMLWANAVRALGRLGLADAIRARGTPEASGAVRTWRGDTLIGVSPRDLERRLGEVSVVIHRADLMSILLDALPADALLLGASCAGVRQDDAGVTLQLADGRELRGDILIGADGIHSAVRGALLGPIKPKYAGYTAWRAVVPFVDPAKIGGESWGRGARFGIAPLPDGRIYWFATANEPEGATEPAGARKRQLLELFRGWHAPIEALIAATDEAAILRHDIYDLPPLPRWGAGRVTLLGDAAHAMTPNLGQGACQALEDAVVLARHLREKNDLTAALRVYEAERMVRTQPMVRQARMIGAVGQWSNPLACAVRDLVVKRVLAPTQDRQIDRIIGYRV